MMAEALGMGGDMTNAPERIWAHCFDANENGGWTSWGGYARAAHLHPLDDRERVTGAEYIRADIVTPPQITDAMVEAGLAFINLVEHDTTKSDENIMRALLTAAMGAM